MSSQPQKDGSTTYDGNDLPLATEGVGALAQRIQQEPELAVLLLSEFVSLFVNGEPDVARIMLRDLVNATIGFEELAQKTGKPSKSLHRMLSLKGNPTMDNLAAIVDALRQQLQIKEFSVMTVAAESTEPADFTEQLKSA